MNSDSDGRDCYSLVEHKVQEGNYMVALQLLSEEQQQQREGNDKNNANNNLAFQPGDGSWTEWLFLAMHHDFTRQQQQPKNNTNGHASSAQQDTRDTQYDGPLCRLLRIPPQMMQEQNDNDDSMRWFVAKASSSLSTVTCFAELERHWLCFLDLSHALQPPPTTTTTTKQQRTVSSLVTFFVHFLGQSPSLLVKAVEGHPQGLEIVLYHYEKELTETDVAVIAATNAAAVDWEDSPSSPSMRKERQRARGPLQKDQGEDEKKDEGMVLAQHLSVQSPTRHDKPPTLSAISSQSAVSEDLQRFANTLSTVKEEYAAGRQEESLDRQSVVWFLQEMQQQFQQIQIKHNHVEQQEQQQQQQQQRNTHDHNNNKDNNKDMELIRLRQRVTELEKQLSNNNTTSSSTTTEPKEWTLSTTTTTTAVTDSSVITTDSSERIVANLKHDHMVARRADQLRIRYLEQLLNSQDHRTCDAGTSYGATHLSSTPLRRHSNSPAPIAVTSSDVVARQEQKERFQKLAQELERSEELRAKALEELQMERVFYAEKMRQLQTALKEVVKK